MLSKGTASQPASSAFDDDDFQVPPTLTPKTVTSTSKTGKTPLRPSANLHRPSKKPKPSVYPGKENIDPNFKRTEWDAGADGFYFDLDENCSLESIPSSIDCEHAAVGDDSNSSLQDTNKMGKVKMNEGYLRNSIESRLLRSRAVDCSSSQDFEELDVLLKLCEENNDNHNEVEGRPVQCPLCGIDISDLNEELRHIHTNDCLDKCENQAQKVEFPSDDRGPQLQQELGDASEPSAHRVFDVSPVTKWLESLGLARYGEAFVREEIDWDTLQWLTEEDLFNIGVTALGPRKKIVHALSQMRKKGSRDARRDVNAHEPSDRTRSSHVQERNREESRVVNTDSKTCSNKLITDFFPGSVSDVKKDSNLSSGQCLARKRNSGSGRKLTPKGHGRNGKLKDIPQWCCVPGTPFRVDAFKYLRGDCSHWFLTHFHMDHYQGLTRSFCHGKIYCSLITARLVNMKIGIPWDRIQVLPLNQKISVAGVEVTCLDANHCPGSMLILFEPPNGKVVLHTGDFRFNEEMASMSVLQACRIHSLILDTTYCNPQYDFPKQEVVIQFVIDAIQAEAFNPKTLFLIGSYTIGRVCSLSLSLSLMR